jgi:tetracycline 7-halogenase / FADH2 O2-dependent halogenase
MAPDRPAFDVAIVGTGLTGALLAAVLSRGGARVCLLEAEERGVVPSGVSTVPQSSFSFELIAARYGVPEAGLLADSKRLRRRVSPLCGSQQTLGFAYHRAGVSHDGWDAAQFNVPGEHGEAHLYRPDVDSWLAEVAVGYGCQLRRLAVTTVRRVGDRVVLSLGDGSIVTASCVVDTSGPGSAVAAALGATQLPLPSSRARAVSAVLTGVLPFEDVVAPLPNSKPWSTGTVHHVFDGGLLWVAPFGTGRGDGRARKHRPAAVGLVLDERRHPGTGDDPEKELLAVVERFPSVARQFADARVRRISGSAPAGWLASQRVEDRMMLLDGAAFGIAPLLCRDLEASAELVYTVAGDLLAAVRDGDFSASRFGYSDRLQAAMATTGDRISAAALNATADYRLWNGFLRVWLLGTMFAALTLKKNLKLLQAGAFETAFAQLRQPVDDGASFAVLEEYAELLELTLQATERAAAGEWTAAHAGERVFAAINAARCVPPIYGFGDPTDREYVLTLGRRLRTLAWLRGSAPQSVRALLGSYGLRGNARVSSS